MWAPYPGVLGTELGAGVSGAVPPVCVELDESKEAQIQRLEFTLESKGERGSRWVGVRVDCCMTLRIRRGPGC